MERFDELLRQSSDFDLSDGVFCLFAEQDNTIQVDKYEEAERVITLVWHASGIIDNGGFHYLFEGDFNGDPGFKFTAAAFEAIGANRAYQAFKDLFQLFPGGRLPFDTERRLMIYEGIPDKERTRIDRLFLSDSDIIPTKLAAYIRQHQDEIKQLLKKKDQPRRREGR